jgi:hypothetical protein
MGKFRNYRNKTIRARRVSVETIEVGGEFGIDCENF